MSVENTLLASRESNDLIIHSDNGVKVAYDNGTMLMAQTEKAGVCVITPEGQIAPIIREDNICIFGLCKSLSGTQEGEESAKRYAWMVENHDYRSLTMVSDFRYVPSALTELRQVMTAAQCEIGPDEELVASVVRKISVNGETYIVYGHIGNGSNIWQVKNSDVSKITIPEGVGNVNFHSLTQEGNGEIAQSDVFKLEDDEAVVITSGALHEGSSSVGNIAELVLASSIENTPPDKAAVEVVDRGSAGNTEKAAIVVHPPVN